MLLRSGEGVDENGRRVRWTIGRGREGLPERATRTVDDWEGPSTPFRLRRIVAALRGELTTEGTEKHGREGEGKVGKLES